MRLSVFICFDNQRLDSLRTKSQEQSMDDLLKVIKGRIKGGKHEVFYLTYLYKKIVRYQISLQDRRTLFDKYKRLLRNKVF